MIAKIYLFSDTFNAKSEFEIAVDKHGNILYERAISFDVILNPHHSFSHIDDWKGSWGLRDELEICDSYAPMQPHTIDGTKSLHLTYKNILNLRRLMELDNVIANRLYPTLKDCGCELDVMCTCRSSITGGVCEELKIKKDAYTEWVLKTRLRLAQEAAETQEPKPCSCDIMLLMQAGCTCGGK